MKRRIVTAIAATVIAFGGVGVAAAATAPAHVTVTHPAHNAR